MPDVPADKIAALAAEKLAEALPNITSYSADGREAAAANVRVALALVSLLAETREPAERKWMTGNVGFFVGGETSRARLHSDAALMPPLAEPPPR